MMAPPPPPPTYNLTELEGLNANSGYYAGQAAYDNIREQALQEAALALGTQAGLNYESGQINLVLNQNADTLTHIFDFNQVMYADNVMPPVLNTANNLVNINPGGSAIRIAGVTYTILAPAHFVTAPPTWRDYLYMNYPAPELPDKTLLPQNSQEAAFWQQNVNQGWQAGINQGMSIFTINLNRLVQDFNGMLLYKELLLKNMVSPYAVDKTEQGVTGSGQHMIIDDRLLKLTTQPELLLNNSSKWQALPSAIASPAAVQTPVPNAPSIEGTAPGESISPEAPEALFIPTPTLSSPAFSQTAPPKTSPASLTKPQPPSAIPSVSVPTPAVAPVKPIRPPAVSAPISAPQNTNPISIGPINAPSPATTVPANLEHPIGPVIGQSSTALKVVTTTATQTPPAQTIDLNEKTVEVIYTGAPQPESIQTTPEAIESGNQSSPITQ